MNNRGQRFALLLRSLIAALRHGGAKKNIQNPQRILVIQLAKLGDMICTTPMFRAIKNKFPDAELIVMGNLVNAQVVHLNPDVDQYIAFDGDSESAVKRLRSLKIDVGIMCTPYAEGLAMMLRAGIPSIVAPVVKGGHSPVETKLYRMIRHFVITEPFRMGEYAPREYLGLLRPMGIETGDTKKYIYYSPEASTFIQKFFAEHDVQQGRDRIILIAPSAGNKIKVWPADRFAALSDHITDAYSNARVIIIGAKSDNAEVEPMYAAIKNRERVINSYNLFSIDKMKALVAASGMLISNDSGPIYIAEALGIPTLDIVGPVDEREQPPISEKHLVVVPKRDKPALYVLNAKGYDAVEARRQAEATTVAEVIGAFEELAGRLGWRK